MTLNSSLSVFRPLRSLYTLQTYYLVKIIWFEDRIVLFSFGSSFYIKHFNTRKYIVLSLAITGIDVNDIIRYPSSSLKKSR